MIHVIHTAESDYDGPVSSIVHVFEGPDIDLGKARQQWYDARNKVNLHIPKNPDGPPLGTKDYYEWMAAEGMALIGKAIADRAAKQAKFVSEFGKDSLEYLVKILGFTPVPFKEDGL